MNQQQTNQINNLLNGLQLTQVEQLELQAINNQQMINELLSWDDMQYNSFVYNSGRNYLIFYFNGNSDYIIAAENNKLFWSWWRMNFIGRDTSYTASYEDLKLLNSASKLTIYLHIHNALTLIDELKMNQQLCNEIQKQVQVKTTTNHE